MFELPLLVAVIALGVRYLVQRKGKEEVEEKATEFRVGHEEWQTNKKLWDLLKDEDPAWLLAMGIEEPTQYQEARKAKAENKRRYERDKLLAMKPMTAAAYGGNFDRGVEQELERRLRNNITPETLGDMSRAERQYAAGALQAQLMGNTVAAQQQMNQQMYEQERRLQQQDDRLRSAYGSMGLGGMVGLGSIYSIFGRH